MRRLILFLIVGAVGVAITPSLRQRALPYVEPYAKPALDPLFAWKTRSDLAEIARLLDTSRAMGQPLPEPGDFSAFLTRAMGEEGELDPWGNRYYLRKQRRQNVVGSPGPDSQPGTADDITRSIPAF
ncbi:hypothetical protein BH23GEM4_BH23GEM4_25270 [soil metagenome]